MSISKFTVTKVAGVGQVPSLSQVPKQCNKVVSPLISGNILSHQLPGSAHGKSVRFSLVSQSSAHPGLLKKA